MKDNKGFIAISLIYSFFLVFFMVLLGIMADYIHNRILLNDIKKVTQKELNERSEFNPITLPFKDGGYKSGDEVSFVNEKWLVTADSNGDYVTLVLKRALTNSELNAALKGKPDNESDDVYNRLLKSNVLQNAINEEKVYMCYKGIPTTETEIENVCYFQDKNYVGNYREYSWSISIVKYVVDYWYENNALLQRAQAQGGLESMNGDILDLDYDPYVRVLTNEELYLLGKTSSWWNYDLVTLGVEYTTSYEVHPVINVKISH